MIAPLLANKQPGFRRGVLRLKVATSRQQPGSQIPMSQRHPLPPTDHLANANPEGTAKATKYLTKRCTCTGPAQKSCSPHFHVLCFHAISNESDISALHPKPLPKSSPDGTALSEANVTQKTPLYPQTPRDKREPFAVHSGRAATQGFVNQLVG